MFAFSTPDALAAGKLIADAIGSQTSTLQKELKAMTAEFEAVKNEVAALKEVDKGVVALLTSLHDQLVAAKDDPAAVQAIADDIKAEKDTLAAAVIANTPAAPQ